MDYIAPRT